MTYLVFLSIHVIYNYQQSANNPKCLVITQFIFIFVFILKNLETKTKETKEKISYLCYFKNNLFFN